MNEHMPSVPVCPECGSPLAGLSDKYDRLDRECSRLHGENRHLKGELTKVQGGGSDTRDIQEVWDAWIAPRASRPGRTPVLSDDRKAAIRKGIKEHSKEGAVKAVKQSGKTPYLSYGRNWVATGSPRDRRDDVTEIFAKALRAEQLIAAHDGDDKVPDSPVVDDTPEAQKVHRLNQGWTPILRATTALRREYGFDMVSTEWSEKDLLNEWSSPIRYHSICPCHKQGFIGLRLWTEGDTTGQLHVECDGACSPAEIRRAVFGLEDKQVERAKALTAFYEQATPETLAKVVTALGIRKTDTAPDIGRRMGIHDDEVLGLYADPREVFKAAA